MGTRADDLHNPSAAEMRHNLRERVGAQESELARVTRQRDALLAACREMHRTLTAPSRILLDSTREELEPWLPMLNEVLAACEEKP